MENKMKTAEGIVRALVSQGEPFYEDALENDELVCTLCSGLHGTDYRRIEWTGDDADDGLSIMVHCAECAWRQAVEYVQAAGK